MTTSSPHLPPPQSFPHTEMRVCDGRQFKRLAQAALMWLEANHQIVNALNVFPVPDGDTGTNMLLTMQAAWKEIADSSNGHVGQLTHALAHGALMGARGNSGVILSQIWRGFARSLDGVEAFDADQAVRALQQASDTAYRGVGRPVEGTILTVIKAVAQGAAHGRTRSADLRLVLAEALDAGERALAQTPELLPVLKQAGVVDSGGKGLVIVLEGMLRLLRGLPLDKPVEQAPALLSLASVGAAMEAVEPGQEWETVVDFRPRGSLQLPDLYSRLEAMGTSIQVGEGDGMYRVHIHLLKNRRYEPIELAEELGTVTNVHMENLLDQMESQGGGAEPLALFAVAPGQVGVISVSPGEGLSRVMASLGAAAIISGGQTMNPSTQDFLQAIGDLPTDRILLLPNNKNILMAARQAAEMSVKQVRVVPSRTVPQGIAALLNYSAEADLETQCTTMERAIADIQSGEITRATRSVELDGVAVAEGQIIGLHNGQLRVAGDDLEQALLHLLSIMQAEGHELVTLYYGADLSPTEAEVLADTVRAAYTAQTVELHPGGQPHYYFIISVE